jgi:hypothetical protein
VSPMQMGKCLSGQMSFWANVFWANVFLGQCLSGQTSYGQMSYGQMFYGQMSYGQMSFWANVFLGKRLMGKCLMGKCHSRQMNLGQMSHGKRRMGKCCITLFSVTLCLGTRGLHTSQCLGRLAREKTPKESCSAKPVLNIAERLRKKVVDSIFLVIHNSSHRNKRGQSL